MDCPPHPAFQFALIVRTSHIETSIELISSKQFAGVSNSRPHAKQSLRQPALVVNEISAHEFVKSASESEPWTSARLTSLL